ncbi:hypothetical protein GDR29_14225 [Xanthomonas oryzae pv. oryzae]|nr:hypothetical protein GDR29_14225 [Xanthomonas oryzae pv. oryzae]
MQADARAFTALMQHLCKVDGDRHTVILVQVEKRAGRGRHRARPRPGRRGGARTTGAGRDCARGG